MSKKTVSLVSALLVIVFLFTACTTPAATTQPPAEPTKAAEATTAPAAPEATKAPEVTAPPAAAELKGKIVIWHSKKTEEINSLNAIIDAFKAANPGITVEQLFVPDNDLRNKFETAVGSGSGPTLLIGASDWGPASLDGALVQDISKDLTAGVLDTLNAAAADSVKYKDAIVGLPINLKGVLMFRNKSIMPEPAKDFADLIEKAKAADKGDVKGLDFETGFFFMAGHLAAQGATLMDPTTGEPKFNDEKGVAWLNMVKTLKDAGIDMENNNDNDVTLFKEQKVGVVIDGLWNAKALSDAIGADNLVIDPWPAGMSGYVQNDNIYLTTSAAGDDAVASLKFMEFFVTPEAQKLWAEVGTADKPMAAGIPVVKGLDVTDPVAKMAVAAFDKGTAFPTIPQMGSYWDPMNNAVLSVKDKGTDPAAALQEAFDAVSKAVAQ